MNLFNVKIVQQEPIVVRMASSLFSNALKSARLIDEEVGKRIPTIYVDLPSDELLTRWLPGQNANESLNSTLWRITPKHMYSSRKIIEIGANIAAGMFNEGYSTILSNYWIWKLANNATFLPIRVQKAVVRMHANKLFDIFTKSWDSNPKQRLTRYPFNHRAANEIF